MLFTGHHLFQLAALLLLISTLEVQGKRVLGYDESWTSSEITAGKTKAGAISGHRRRGSKIAPKIIDDVVPNLVAIDHFRKPFDQFKWPWKNYEEWKRHQKKIEDKIDRMLKPRNRRFPLKPKTSRSAKNGKTKRPKTGKKKVKKMKNQQQHKKKKSGAEMSYSAPQTLIATTTTESATGSSIATPFPYEAIPTGGIILSVKYYSTNE